MRFHLFRDQNGQWRWRLVAANGRIVADSGEGYTRRYDCETAVGRVVTGVHRVWQRQQADGSLPWA